MNFQRQMIALYTVARKEIVRILRIWLQTIVPPVITMTLYFIIFGNLIGRRIGEMGGFEYMQYMAPGLIMMSVITNSYGNVVSSFFAAKFQGHLQEMLVAPMKSYVIILGHVAGGIVRGLAVGAVVTVVALFFTKLEVQNPFIAISILVLTAIVFSLGGMINAIFARKFDDVAIIPSFVLGPLTYLGGVFYTTSLLPDFWAKVSAFNPILYMVNGFRYGMLGVSDIDIVTAYVIILAFVVLAFGTCFYLLSRGIGIRE
ncbi:MAG: ABC transporter permease [Gammaproteobacteria bacterium]|jgi:ABC-2 type transport system permease protein|nr:ABC transporter permease [Gammaproteobacteria bacterium]MDP6617627.1 ABC transporter permease [Gammaproteobacteria bacterium]MDP6694504.1 ABC transporter permease [Gammaproteobacteria bacterium]MDP7041086.1 ABC transporter permease [Gammaproteobacteria bacterium]